MLDIKRGRMFRNINSSPEIFEFRCSKCGASQQSWAASATVWCTGCSIKMPPVSLIATNILRRLEYHIGEETKKPAAPLIMTPAAASRASQQRSIVSFLRGEHLEKNV
jgi:hypothetical protein